MKSLHDHVRAVDLGCLSVLLAASRSSRRLDFYPRLRSRVCAPPTSFLGRVRSSALRWAPVPALAPSRHDRARRPSDQPGRHRSQPDSAPLRTPAGAEPAGLRGTSPVERRRRPACNRGPALLRASRRRSCGAGAGALEQPATGPHRERRLHRHDAGGGGAAWQSAADRRQQARRDASRAAAGAAALEAGDPLALAQSGLIWQSGPRR